MSASQEKPTVKIRAGRILTPVIAALALFAVAQTGHAALVLRDVNTTLNAENLDSFNLDVNLDGINDFIFGASLVPGVVGFDTVDVPFASSNGAVVDGGSGSGFPTASRLALGTTISASSLFSAGSFDQANLFSFDAFFNPGGSGNFGGQTGFLGLRFDGAGGPSFGFAQITVNDVNATVNPLGLTIGSVGFNDVPGQPVTIAGAVNSVPEPGSLALLGAGGFGFLVLRGRRKAALAG